jgi:DNA-binding transcriptional regulator YiaG
LNRLIVHRANRLDLLIRDSLFQHDFKYDAEQLYWRNLYALLPIAGLRFLCHRSKIYIAPILGAICSEFYIERVTKSVFTKRYNLMLSLLASIREDRGLSQRALSGKLKKAPTYVSKYERGERRLDVVEFLEIMKVLKADPHEIIKKLLDSPK